MHTITIGSYELGAELWCRPASLRDWQFGAERITGRFPGWLLWIGPLHVAVNRKAAGFMADSL